MNLRLLLMWCLVWTLSFDVLRAQSDDIIVSIIIPPPYSPYLQDYLQYENKMVIQLQSLSTQTLSVKLTGSIEGDNGIALRTDPDYMPSTPITLLAGSILRIPASSGSRGFFDPDNVSYEGPEDLKMKILKSGILPEGLYTVCIQAVDYQTNDPLSAEAPAGCALLPISYPTPPQIVSPECEGTIDAQLPFFQWTLPGGNTGNASLVYDLYIVEWLDGSNPQDLMQLAIDYNAGNAIVKTNLNTPTYQYQPYDIKLIKEKTYLWSVRVRDRLNNITFENQGQSEICSFTIGDPFDDTAEQYILPPTYGHYDFQVVQTRTLVEGKLSYKFPGESTGLESINRTISLETGAMPFIVAEESPFELSVMEQPVAALIPKNYLDAFPVSTFLSKPLENITVKLIESWVITDCDVTYLPEDAAEASWTEHKAFFILPDDYLIPYPGDGGRTLQIQGIADGGPDNPLSFGMIPGGHMYNRVLAVDRTDGSGNYSFRFTQSTPGLNFLNYPGEALIYMECGGGEVEQEENEFVHILDIVSNPADQISNPVDYYSNPSGLVVNEGEQMQGIQGDIQMPAGGQNTLRSGSIQSLQGQQGYKNIQINGGHLFKVLRLEVASPFYYSPDLIFWTSPGDTLKLPDQVSYVKSFDLDLKVYAGDWNGDAENQFLVEGDEVPNVDILFSRKKAGLPSEIPITEGQGLRDYEGESSSESNWIETEDMMAGLNDDPSEYDSVSVLETLGEGNAYFTRLVAGHAYYVQGNAPLDGGVHYNIPLNTEIYQVFESWNCEQNIGSNFNSFCQHKPIYIKDILTAFPQAPRAFGFVYSRTGDDKAPEPNVLVTIRRLHNYQYYETYTTYTNYAGYFQFSNLPVSQGGNSPYTWKIFFEKSGFADQSFPENTLKTLKPGQQWDLNDVEMVPLGNLTGIVQDEDGKTIQALVRLESGPHVQTTLVPRPSDLVDFCGVVNNFGDAINDATKIPNAYYHTDVNYQHQATQAAKFVLPAQSGSNKKLVIIPLPEQYFQDTCILDVEDVPFGETQWLGKIIVKEKLHRISFAVKGPNGENVQARISVDEHVRQTNNLGFAAFRFASPEINYRVRIDPELASFVPVDTIMRIPISKEYLSHTFNLKEGRKLKVVVIRDQSEQQQQTENPIPLAGVTVQTLLSSSPTGNSYIECITGSDGVCTLEGVPTALPSVEVTAWKQDDTQLYIGKTVSISTTRPLNPPFTIALKVLPNTTMPDIWGFPVTITDADIVAGQGGTMDTLFEGFIIELPENARFKSREDDVRIPFPKIKFKYSGQRDEDNRKIMEPVSSSITLQQAGAEITLFDKFDVVLTPPRSQGGAQMTKLSLKKTSPFHGKMEGVVQTELSSFNTSYDFTGKFYLGKTPTEYNILVFNTGIPFYEVFDINQMQVMGQEPAPGPNDFYLMDIGPGNRPRSHEYRIFQFEASSDSSRSFVSNDAFYIHTILHTDIDYVTPRDLQLSVGKIVVTPETIEDPDNNNNNLEFKMGKLWRYYSTSPFRYDPELGGITVTSGFIQTGQIDVPVSHPVIKPDKLIMSHIGNIDSLTLSGIKDIEVEDGVNIVLSKGDYYIGWKLSVGKLNSNGEVIPDAVVAEIRDLPLLRDQDVIQIRTILLNSESDDIDLTLHGEVRPYDIADLTVSGITTGPGYFILDGTAFLGRQGVRVPGLGANTMGIKYQGANQNLHGEIITNFAGTFETAGQVSFKMDGSMGNSIKQYYDHQNFVCHGEMRVYQEGSGEFKLHGILEVTKQKVRIHVIDEDLDIDNIAHIDYIKADQFIAMGSTEKRMIVRSGKQEVSGSEWQPLSFKANMENFNGVDANQPPITFVKAGEITATDANIEVDNIDLGFAEIALTYNFAEQSLFGYMDFNPPGSIYMGPVSMDRIEAQILVEPDGFLFSALIDGAIAGDAFNARLGLLLGSHIDIPPDMISFTMQYAKNKTPPETFADRELNGFFITGRVDLIDVPMTEVNLAFFGVSGGAEVGFDGRFSMDFSRNGDVAFDLAVLAFAGIMVEAYILIPPVPCLDPTICLSMTAQVLLEASLRKTGGQWEVSGRGCGSVLLSGAICGISDSFGGKVDIEFSSEHDPRISARLNASCGGENEQYEEYLCD